jgi:hypothetical protein
MANYIGKSESHRRPCFYGNSDARDGRPRRDESHSQGRETLGKADTHRRHQCTAIVADRQKAVEAGMDAYLVKPIRPDELYKTLHRLAGGEAGPRIDPKAG